MEPMRITRIEDFRNAWVGFVGVTADDGGQGWDEAPHTEAVPPASVPAEERWR